MAKHIKFMAKKSCKIAMPINETPGLKSESYFTVHKAEDAYRQ